jgi:hypothetical protein
VMAGTDPLAADTDGDGVPDGLDVDPTVDSCLDAALPVAWFHDADLDGVGAGAVWFFACPSLAFPPDAAAPLSGDCDDTNPLVTLGEPWYVDEDGDGAGDPDLEGLFCVPPGGDWVSSDTDCDDSDPRIRPGRPEACDGIDNDCDGGVDEGFPARLWYVDSDADDFGRGDPVASCEPPAGSWTDEDGDCDDSRDDIYPGAEEICGDAIDQDCQDGDLLCHGSDGDGDGFCDGESCVDGAMPGDCDDLDPAINPWAAEICNGIDDDCNARVDDGLSPDEDEDGRTALGACGGTADDCNDAVGTIFPGAEETCNGIDDDCDTVIDEGLFVDGDGDGWPAAGGCGIAVADCDDDDPAINPGVEEIPSNGVDDDCDGEVDEDPQYTDDDGDGYCEAAVCNDGSLTGDCDDANAAISPAAIEVLDGLDNDCDGVIDELGTEDLDGDGFTPTEGDCNDTDPLVSPEAEERCNGLDDNCDGLVDASELDLDSDGWRLCDGDCDDNDPRARPYLAEDCSDGIDNDCDGTIDQDSDNDGDGVTTCEGDCRDQEKDGASVHPGADETCNDIDDDCDGVVDEGFDLDGDGVQSCEACNVEVCDCDDLDALSSPGNSEVCGDGRDNDCDGTTDVDEDRDLDGWGTCEGDCNDADPFVSPGASEVCDGRDNDCDGFTDETFDNDEDGYLACAGDCDDFDATSFFGNEEACDMADNDCNGVVDDPWPDGDGDAVSVCAGDCDDTSPKIYPGADEVCGDGIDNNCNGRTDWADKPCDVAQVAPPRWFCQSTGPLPGSAWLVVGGMLVALRRRRYDAEHTDAQT